MLLASCSIKLTTVPVQKMQEDEGQFNLIYLVNQKRDDLRNAVILDRLGDEYIFVPDVRDFDYEVLQDISIREATLETDVFFRSFPFITGGTFFGITNRKGDTIGYEFRPYYNPKYYGTPDILDIDYSLKSDGRIYIDIGIKYNLIQRSPIDF